MIHIHARALGFRAMSVTEGQSDPNGAKSRHLFRARELRLLFDAHKVLYCRPWRKSFRFGHGALELRIEITRFFKDQIMVS